MPCRDQTLLSFKCCFSPDFKTFAVIWVFGIFLLKALDAISFFLSEVCPQILPLYLVSAVTLHHTVNDKMDDTNSCRAQFVNSQNQTIVFVSQWSQSSLKKTYVLHILTILDAQKQRKWRPRKTSRSPYIGSWCVLSTVVTQYVMAAVCFQSTDRDNILHIAK